MVAYAVVDYQTEVGPLATVIAAMETQLETLDSTTNPIRLMEVKHVGGDRYVGIIIYDG